MIIVAIQCIADAYGFDQSQDRTKLSIKPASLESIFEVYLKTQQKLKPAENAPKSSPSTPDESAVKQAEDLKSKGNKALVEKDLDNAIDYYTQAIALNSTSAVYFSNRAAAYSQQGNHDLAIEDCKKALALDAGYSKAYSRMGLAYYSTGEYAKAAEAYEKVLELDPANEAAKKSLQTARSKMSLDVTDSSPTSDTTRSSAAPGGNPLAGFPGLGGAGGGMPDLASLMSNPALMNMAQQFMSNPQMAGMMQNLMGANGGSAPNMNNIGDLLNNPEVMNMAQQMAQDPNIRNMFNGNGADGNRRRQ